MHKVRFFGIPHPFVALLSSLALVGLCVAVSQTSLDTHDTHAPLWAALLGEFSLFLLVGPWIAGIVQTARLQKWGWLVSVTVLVPFGLVAYGFLGPTKTRPAWQPPKIQHLFALPPKVHAVYSRVPHPWIAATSSCLYVAAFILVPYVQSAQDQQRSTPQPPDWLLVLVFVLSMTFMGGWVAGFVDAARLGYWGWFFVALIPYTTPVYGFFGPREPRIRSPRMRPQYIPRPVLQPGRRPVLDGASQAQATPREAVQYHGAPALPGRRGQLRVFVSHASADVVFANRLSNDLRIAGADVWLDSSHMGAGDFVARINSALQNRDVVVLVLSPDAILSKWVNQEFNAAVTRSNQGLMRPPIVVMARPCQAADIPPLWTVYHRYDASSDYIATLRGVAGELGLNAPTPGHDASDLERKQQPAP